MTDQPLPLKPCPFCGKNVKLMDGERFLFECGCSAIPQFMLDRLKWDDAYCWKLLAEKEAELKAYIDQVNVYYGKIQELSSRLEESRENLKQALDRIRGK